MSVRVVFANRSRFDGRIGGV
ncbi:uncharacterized protein G2W53_021972 [Senna tora]|uniref:Uncharacterized protein n=1 Tax=Senna tora TaxID=362788 RepID=A0A834TKF0_9FABA|nr:uncharacterized protein G2W53_021972 [Senna tora]